MLVGVEVLDEGTVRPDFEVGAVHEHPEGVPFAFAFDVREFRGDVGEDAAHGLELGRIVVFVEELDAVAAIDGGAVFGGVEIDAGIDPALDVEIEAEVEVFVDFVRREPSRRISGFGDENGTVVDGEGGFGAFFDVPAG